MTETTSRVSNPVKVGIFSAITIVIFVLGFYFLKGIDLFTTSNQYYAVYDRVDGLYKSNLVEINGFPVGRVGDMKRDPVTGRIVVRLDLDKSLMVPRNDSTLAQLFSTDFFGTKKISLLLGSVDPKLPVDQQYYNDGDTIRTYFKKDLTEQVGAQIDPLMTKITGMVPTLDSTVRDIRKLFDEKYDKSIYTTMGELNTALAKINGVLDANTENINLTVASLKSIMANIEKNNTELTNIIKNANKITDSIQQANLKQTVENLNKTIVQLNQVVTDINDGKGTLGKLIKQDGLYTKVDSTVASLNYLLKDVKNRPYRYINVSVFGSKKRENRIEKKYNESGK
ncbi:MAG: MlaD family protein [Chitinophagales bacterium]